MNPLHQLRPEWVLFKRRHAYARDRLHRSFQYKSPAIRGMLYAQAVDADREARRMWQAIVEETAGANASIEWQGDLMRPVCVVNGTMLFA